MIKKVVVDVWSSSDDWYCKEEKVLALPEEALMLPAAEGGAENSAKL